MANEVLILVNFTPNSFKIVDETLHFIKPVLLRHFIDTKILRQNHKGIIGLSGQLPKLRRLLISDQINYKILDYSDPTVSSKYNFPNNSSIKSRTKTNNKPPQDDHNPFLFWIRSFAKNNADKSNIFYIPSNSILNNLYKWLNVNADQLVALSHLQIAEAYCYFWDSDHFDEFGIKLLETNDKQYLLFEDVKIPILDKIVYVDLNVTFVGGFLSLPHLTNILKKFHTNVRPFPIQKNPFLKFNAIFYPDISIVESIFKRFNVKNIGELLPYSNDYNSIFIDQKVDIDKVFRQRFSNGELIGIMDFTNNGGLRTYSKYFLEKLPDVVMNRLEQLIKNKSGAKGDILTIPRDVLSIIISGKLKGKDLISLCDSNSKISQKCNSDNQLIFRQALKREFNITFQPGLFDFESARDLYNQVYNSSIIVNYEKGNQLLSHLRFHGQELDSDQRLFVLNHEISNQKITNNKHMGLVSFRDDLSLTFAFIYEHKKPPIISNKLFLNKINNKPYVALFIYTVVELINDEGETYEENEHEGFDMPGLKELGFNTGIIDYSPLWL